MHVSGMVAYSGYIIYIGKYKIVLTITTMLTERADNFNPLPPPMKKKHEKRKRNKQKQKTCTHTLTTRRTTNKQTKLFRKHTICLDCLTTTVN